MKIFCNLNGLKSLIIVQTYFKNLNKPTYTYELILANKPNFFQYSTVSEARLSDFGFLTVTEFKLGFQKQNIKVIYLSQL